MYRQEGFSTCQESSVLLLIIPNPTSSLLTHSLFYKFFSPYGEVEKILIFEKSRLWKAFIEMGSLDQAKKAQEALNGTTLIDGGVMNVYFSTFNTVTLVNNNSGGVDYRQLKQRIQNKTQSLYQYRSEPNTPLKVGSLYEINDLNTFQNSQLEYTDPNSFQNNSTLNYPYLVYPTVQQGYFTQFDDNYKVKSGTLLDEKSKSSSEHNIIHEDLRSRSSTPQTQNTEPIQGRKRLRLTKNVFNSFENNTYEENCSIDVQLQSNDAQQQMGDGENGTQLKIPFINKDDDCFLDLIRQDDDNNNNYQDDSNNDSGSEEITQQDKDIMNAFSNDKQFNFMFSIPEVQIESSSPINKGEKTRKLQDLRFPDLQTLNQEIFKQQSDTFEYIHNDPANYVNPQFLMENQSSKVIYIRGLQHQDICPIYLFNILSNCGNIVVIIFIKHKHSALIQFQQLQYAQNAKDHLNNLPFFKSKLKIFYSNYQEIQLPLPHQSPLTQVYIPSQDQYRFGDGKIITFNPPGQVLHLSNIQKEATYDETYIRNIFIKYGSVLQIKFMHVQRSKHMALIRMSSIEEALNAAAALHGQKHLGRKINISFTKSKI